MKIIEFESVFINAENITAVKADQYFDCRIVLYGCGIPTDGLILDYPDKKTRDNSYKTILNQFR